MKWRKARKKAVVIHFREIIPNEMIYDHKTNKAIPCERIDTREGSLYGFKDRDFIIQGVEGEIYPIKKEIFYKTYDMIENE